MDDIPFSETINATNYNMVAVKITDLGGKETTRYIAFTESDCKDSTDASVYREVIRLKDVITMGKIIGEPIRRDVALATKGASQKMPYQGGVWSNAHCNDFGQSTQAGHSPLPWHIGMNPGPMIYGPQGEQIANMHVAMLDQAEHKANARLIVASVNHAGKLAEALRDLVESTRHSLTWDNDYVLLTKVTNALAAWEGAQK